MNKPIYLGLSKLEVSKTVIQEFWYDYIKPKYEEEANYVAWIQSFTVNIKTEDVYKDIANNVKKDLIHQTIKLKDPYQQVKIKK